MIRDHSNQAASVLPCLFLRYSLHFCHQTFHPTSIQSCKVLEVGKIPESYQVGALSRLSKTHQPGRTAPVLWLLFPVSLKQQTTGVGFDSSFTRDLAQSSKVLIASPRKHGYKISHSTMSWDLSQIPGFEGKQVVTRNQFDLALQLQLCK